MRLDYVTVDVFTHTRFGGNPLAVVFDAGRLSDAEMQYIATEFNLSETTFTCPPRERENDANVRIFTPTAELPFAGHPNVGTAYALARRAEAGGTQVSGFKFEEKAGLVEVELWLEDGVTQGAEIAAPATISIGDEFPANIVARACGLATTDIETRSHAPCLTSTGTPFISVELKSRAALDKAVCMNDVFVHEIPADVATGIHLYVHTADGEVDIDARMFGPLFGIAEDPATGSATTNLIGLLASLDPATDVMLEKRITQGVLMGRPSLLRARAIKRAGVVEQTFVGGTCVPVMVGTIDLG